MNDLGLKFLLFQGYYPHLALLVMWLLKSTALLILAMGITSLLRQRSARLRCWIWRLVFLGLAGMIAWQFAPAAMKEVQPRVKVAFRQDTAAKILDEAIALRIVRDGQTVMRLAQEKRASGPPLPPWDQQDTFPALGVADYLSEPWAIVEEMLPWVWASLTAAMLLTAALRTVFGLSWLRRHSKDAGSPIPDQAALVAGRMGVRARWLVRVSKGAASPLLFGFLRPLIYLPPAAVDWDAAKLEAVFVHEFAHWRRRDFWWVQFGRFMLALLWWNPLLRLALARMNAEAEEAADDMVVLDGRRGEAYAQALVEIAAGDPRGGSGIGVSMLGYRSLERRIRRVLQDNEWRGKLGRLAIAALVATGLIFAGVSSVYMAMAAPENATPSVKNSLLTGEMRTVAERVVANTKRRLEALRHTHAKMESQLSIEQDGKLTMAPDVSRIEAWNDLWTNLHKVEYRPQVSRWIDGGAPFFVEDQNDICDGKKAYYFNPDDIADVERYAAGPRAMFVDYLSVQPSKDVIRILESMLNMNTVPESMTYSFGYVDWKGRRALQIQEVYTRDGARIQIRTLVIRPDANDLVSLSEIGFPRNKGSELGNRWEADEVQQLPGTADWFASKFTMTSQHQGVMEFTTTTIKDLEVLTSLPANIAALPKSPELQYISKSGKAEQPKVMAITCVDPDTGVAVPDVRVEVRLNAQPLQKLRTDAQGALSIPLPTDEVTSLSLKALKKGFAGRTITWRKYGDPLKLPDSFQIQLPPGSPVAGRVVDENGQPIAGATVYMYLSGGPRTWSVFGDRCAFPKTETKTNAQGEWSLPDFPPDLDGLVYRVSAPGYKATTDSGVADFRRDSGLTYASLRDGQATIKLGHGLRLSGKITDPDGRPVEKCRLTIGQDIWGTNCPVAESNAQGEYSLPGLSPGKTWITAEAPGHQPTAREIELPLKEASLDFVVQPGKVIRGRVTAPDGQPCAGLNVGVDKWNDLRTLAFSTQTDADGNFVWNGAPDAPVEFNFGGCQSREFLSGLWLQPAAEVQSIVMKPAIKVSGRVVDAKTGQPVQRFTVTPGRRLGANDIYWNKASALNFDRDHFEWQTNRMGDKHVLLFEAPGYKKFETRDFATEQQSVTEVVKLEAE